MAHGFEHNSELLLSEADRRTFAERAPQLLFAFDDPDLRAIFLEHETEAARGKRRFRRLGQAAVAAVAFASLLAVTATWLDPWPGRAVAAASIAAFLAAAGLFVLRRTLADPRRWLLHRFLCERVRQLHFQTLVRWAPLILDSARTADHSRFLEARAGRTARFRARFLQPAEARFLATLEGTEAESLWMVEPVDGTVAAGPLATLFLAALEDLRLHRQIDFTAFKLSADPKEAGSILRRRDRLAAAGAFSGVMVVFLVAASAMLHLIEHHDPKLTEGAALLFALIGVAARSLEEGLQVHAEAARYTWYLGSLRNVADAYEDAREPNERLRHLERLEVYAAEELAAFLKDHRRSRFLF